MSIFKRNLFLFLRVAITLAFLFFLVKLANPRVLSQTLVNASKPILAVAFLFFTLIYILIFLRWKMFIQAYNLDVPLGRLIVAFAGGIFFNALLPTTIGGDFVRSLDLASYLKKTKQVVATVFLDRLSGYIGVVIVSLAAFLWGYKFIDSPSLVFLVMAIAVILLIILAVFFNKPVFSKTKRLLSSLPLGRVSEALINLHSEIHLFRYRKGVILVNLSLSVVIQILSSLVFYILALAVGIKISAIYFFIFLPVVSATTLLPISIGGLGVRDATAILFFSQAGVDKNLAFAMSLLFFSFILIYAVIGGFVYVINLYYRRI